MWGGVVPRHLGSMCRYDLRYLGCVRNCVCVCVLDASILRVCVWGREETPGLCVYVCDLRYLGCICVGLCVCVPDS